MHPIGRIICTLVTVGYATLAGLAHGESLYLLTEQDPPFNYQENGQVKGLITQKAIDIVRQAGFDFEIAVQPWARAYSVAQSQPNTLIFSMARLDYRENLFHWVAPVHERVQSVYRLRSAADIQVKRVEDLVYYSFTSVRLDAEEEVLKQLGITPTIVVQEQKQKLILLAKGRVQLAPINEDQFLYWCKELNYDPDKFEKIWELKRADNLVYIAASLSTSETVINRLRQAALALDYVVSNIEAEQ